MVWNPKRRQKNRGRMPISEYLSRGKRGERKEKRGERKDGKQNGKQNKKKRLGAGVGNLACPRAAILAAAILQLDNAAPPCAKDTFAINTALDEDGGIRATHVKLLPMGGHEYRILGKG